MATPRIALLPSFSDGRVPSTSKNGGAGKNISDTDSGIENGVDMNIDDPSSEKKRLQYSQEFQLPRVVESNINADIQQASAFAVITALFAGVLLSLVQTIAPDTNTSGWRALRFFAYSSIIINLSGTTLSLVLIKMCSELQYRAQRLIILDPDSLPARVEREGIPRDLLLNRHQLLEGFGMPRGYKTVDNGAGYWVLSGNIFTLVSIMLWIWLAGDIPVASAATAVISIPVFGIAYAIALTKS